jgi:hypothetical protein
VPARTVGQRVDRLEKVVAELAVATRKGFDQVAKQFKETDRRMRETDQQIRETSRRMHEMDKKTDERIDKLVIAIGEFIRRQNARGK